MRKDPLNTSSMGKWNKFEKSWSTFRVKLWGPFSFPIVKSVLWSAHGPVI